MTTTPLRRFFPRTPHDATCRIYSANETLKCDAKGESKNVVYMKLSEEAAAFETDPNFPPDGRHCDWAVFTTAKGQSTFFELKGRHIRDASTQLASTIRYVLDHLEGFPSPCMAYCVTTGGGRPRIPRTGTASVVLDVNKRFPPCILKIVHAGSTVAFL